MKFIEYAISKMATPEGYTSLFKGFVSILALYLVATMQVATLMMPSEAESYAYKAAVEKALKKELSFDELDCKVETSVYVECKMAVYKNDISSAAISALQSLQELLKLLAYLLGAFSVIGFIFSPYQGPQSKGPAG
ncbi:hypothetical protein AO741_12740 [Pseudomonas sp. TTU2014-105ASC]|nr:hypothetical protein AO741_12740 [Pseudomonas sp. TTU2014-105ASC]